MPNNRNGLLVRLNIRRCRSARLGVVSVSLQVSHITGQQLNKSFAYYLGTSHVYWLLSRGWLLKQVPTQGLPSQPASEHIAYGAQTRKTKVGLGSLCRFCQLCQLSSYLQTMLYFQFKALSPDKKPALLDQKPKFTCRLALVFCLTRFNVQAHTHWPVTSCYSPAWNLGNCDLKPPQHMCDSGATATLHSAPDSSPVMHDGLDYSPLLSVT